MDGARCPHPFRVTKGRHFRLKDVDPGDTRGLKSEQRECFTKRLDEPEKNWKFSAADVAERAHWRGYMAAYENAIRATAAPHAPWYVVSADHKWFTRLVVAGAIVDTLVDLDLRYPTLDRAQRAAWREARRALTSERD